MEKFKIYDLNIVNTMFSHADTNNDNILSIDEFITFLCNNNKLLDKMDTIIKSKSDYNIKNDKRNILFKDFPGSPNINNKWRPCLYNLRSPNTIKKFLDNI